MIRTPFVWKSLHLALLAVKDEQIRNLRDELSVARTDRLRAEAARDAAIKQAFEAMTPKPVEAPAPRSSRTPRAPEPPKTLDLAEVDPNDNTAITAIAMTEMPPGKQSGTLLMQKIDSIRAQVRAAHAAKSSRAKEVGTIPATTQVPPEVAARIEDAIAKGKENARVG